MEVKATLRNLRIAPRKVRRVADLVRGKSVADARLQLKFNAQRAAKPLLKLIDSGVANAEHNHGLDTHSLRIKSLMVDQGPMFKRYMARAFGRGAEIQKRTSHIRLVLEGQGEGKSKPVSVGKAAKAKAKVKEANVPAREAADQERHAPAKATASGKREADTNKPLPVDPRMLGKNHKSRQKTQRNSK